MTDRQYSEEEVVKMFLAYKNLLSAKQFCEKAFKSGGDSSFAHQSRFLRNVTSSVH